MTSTSEDIEPGPFGAVRQPLPPSPDGINAMKILAHFFTDDSALAEYIAWGSLPTGDEYSEEASRVSFDVPFERLGDYLALAGGLGWLQWDGKRWASVSSESVTDQVRLACRAIFVDRAREVKDPGQVSALRVLLSQPKITRVVSLLRGMLETDPAIFDAQQDLLNAQNGVVDLRTGELLKHDPKYRFTKITRASYGVNTSHPDWLKTLRALPPAVGSYMQVRFGQATSGHPSSDDKLVIQQGGGRNAKSTLTNGIVNALGDFAAYVPESVLTGGSSHPTDLMTLRGLRLAMIEELPEGKHLPVKRLKELQGTQKITARHMRKDFVTFAATHSLTVNTNYVPKVTETDHGTWERLLLIRFPYTFVSAPDVVLDPEHEREGDPGLRERIKLGEDHVLDAVLHWLVSGAVRWYENGKVIPSMPLEVATDTAAWREEADLILAYANQRIEFDSSSSVATTDLYADFSSWLEAQGHTAWSNSTFGDRFGSHKTIERAKVERGVTRDHAQVSRRHGPNLATPLPTQVRVWRGLRFKTAPTA